VSFHGRDGGPPGPDDRPRASALEHTPVRGSPRPALWY